MAEEGCETSPRPEEAQAQLVQGGDRDALGNLVARLPRRRPQQALAHRRDAVPIPAGKAYLSPVIDCFDGMPAARTIRERLTPMAKHDARGGVRNACRARPP